MALGSIPTENLPTKSHEDPKPAEPRRPLIRSEPGTSSSTSSHKMENKEQFKAFVKKINKENLDPWKIYMSKEDKIKFELCDNVHCLPKYTIIVDHALEFSIYVYNWALPDTHFVYKERKRCIKYNTVKELLQTIEKSFLCNGLPDDDDVKSVVVDPTSQSAPSGTVVRHSLPKAISNEEDKQFEVTVIYRSVDCDVINRSSTAKQDQCSPCSTVLNAIKKASKRKTRASEAPAKPKAPLALCGPEKLRATLKATRLECKDLKVRLHNLEKQIEQNGFSVSDATEKDILKIMAGKNLDDNPHMKFFWDQQMKLLQSTKMGRRYHPQVIRFALSLHAKSASAYRYVLNNVPVMMW